LSSEEKFSQVSLRRLMVKLWPSLRPYWLKFFTGMVLILITTAIELVSPIIVGKTVDVTMGGRSQLSHLWTLCLVFLGLMILRAVVEAGQAFVIQATGQIVMHDLRVLLFSKTERLSVAYFDRNPTGRLLTRVINDIKSLSELFTASMSVLVLDFMIIFGTMVAMFWIHWKLAAITLVSFPLVLFSIRFFGNRLADSYRVVRLRLAEINSFLGENIGAIATIQRLAAEDSRREKFASIVEAHNSAQLNTIGVFALVQPVTNVLNGVAMGTLLSVGGYWVVRGQITVGLLVAFLGYLRNLFQPVRDLVEKYNTFLSAMVSAERVVTILDEPTEWENNGALSLSEDVGPLDIRFEKVTFRYPTRPTPALDQVSFTLAARSSTAVVGATGSGKSTIVRLLLRFYEPNSGEIYFGEKRLAELDKESLRSHIGVVHQEIYLFQGTVRDNLTLGQSRFSESYLISQCERAQLWDFIKHRGGLDMMVQEGGANFSLGERQLLSFARVLVFDTPVLILDEATSSIDRLLEKRLMEAIRETLVGRTSIVIAHRLSTIKRCDKVIVLEKAKLVESGTYDGLLRGNGIFAKFHQINSRV